MTTAIVAIAFVGFIAAWVADAPKWLLLAIGIPMSVAAWLLF